MNRLLGLGFAVVSSLLLLTCQSPAASMAPAPSSASTATVRISFQKPTEGRTVVADWASVITSYAVTLSNASYGTVGPQTVAVGGTAFTGVAAGTWNVSVTAFNAAVVVGGGSLSGQTLTAGAAPTWTVPISGTQSGTGGFVLPFSFPGTATGIDTVTWQIPVAPANAPSLATPQTVSLTGGPATWSGTISQAGITSGAYRLVLTFYRGGTGGTVAGVYSEAMNVWDNVTSSSWLTPAGALLTSRAFAATDFNSTNAALGNLTASTGAWGTNIAGVWASTSFSSSTHAYTLTTNTPVTLTPTASVAGQKIQYTVAGTTTQGATTITSAAPATVSVAAGSTVTLTVTGNDTLSTSTYTVLVGAQSNTSWATTSTPANTAVGIGGPATVSYGAPGTFTGTYGGTASSWTWYLDHSTTAILGPSAASSVAVVASPSTYPIGTHTLMAVVQDSTTLLSYSTSVSFSVIANNPATTGLLGEWMLAGSADDTSGNGNNGVMTGTTAVANHLGVANSALLFTNGSSVLLNTPPLGGGLSTPTSYSISLWASGGVPGAGGETWYEENLFSQLSTNELHTNLATVVDPALRNIITYNFPDGAFVTSASALPVDSTWHHLVFTRTGAERKIYLDNVLTIDDTTTAGTYNTSIGLPITKAMIGGYQHVLNAQRFWFQGSLDSLRIYNRELTTTEINALYHEGGY